MRIDDSPPSRAEVREHLAYAAEGTLVTDGLLDARWEPIIDRVMTQAEVRPDDLEQALSLLAVIEAEWAAISPSQAQTVWLYAEHANKPTYDPALVGKWQLFIPRTAIDDVWRHFAAAVEKGELGISAKVSALLRSPSAHDATSHVVILYAADWRDIDDLRRMLRRIREGGSVAHIYFKRDRETLSSGGNRATVSVWGSPTGDTIRTKWLGDGKKWSEVTDENQAAIIAAIQAQDASG